jgi:hypothetical protein
VNNNLSSFIFFLLLKLNTKTFIFFAGVRCHVDILCVLIFWQWTELPLFVLLSGDVCVVQWRLDPLLIRLLWKALNSSLSSRAICFLLFFLRVRASCVCYQDLIAYKFRLISSLPQYNRTNSHTASLRNAIYCTSSPLLFWMDTSELKDQE